MLQQPAPFPFTGAEAFVRGTADRVTIIQRNRDGSATVKLHPPKFMSAEARLAWHHRGASLTRQVPLADLYKTEREATFCGRPPRQRRRRAR